MYLFTYISKRISKGVYLLYQFSHLFTYMLVYMLVYLLIYFYCANWSYSPLLLSGPRLFEDAVETIPGRGDASGASATSATSPTSPAGPSSDAAAQMPLLAHSAVAPSPGMGSRWHELLVYIFPSLGFFLSFFPFPPHPLLYLPFSFCISFPLIKAIAISCDTGSQWKDLSEVSNLM